MPTNRFEAARLWIAGQSVPYRAASEALAIGAIIGFADTRYAGSVSLTIPAYFIAGALLGLRHTGKSYLCWPLLGASLYIAHVIAMACGRQQPYVEENYRFTENCLLVFIPAGFGLMVGALLRLALSTASRSWRTTGPPVSLFPGSVRQWMVAVACIAVSLGCLHRSLFPPTIYSAGFNEARFQAVHQGMTEHQVMAALGQPLTKKPWGDGCEMWQFSDQYTYTSNYDRRWIFFKNGLVQTVVSDYWVD